MTRLLGVEAYALRHWDEEFPALEVRHNSAGQRVYEAPDLDILRRIRELLFEERYTLAGARSRLESELAGDDAPRQPASGDDRTTIRLAGHLAGGAAIHLDQAAAVARRVGRLLEELAETQEEGAR